MVKATFTNLPAAKQARVQAALLAEFSQHPLAEAQVARIVQGAGIARGAFYKYFDDLADAYQYLFQTVMRSLHASLPPAPSAANVDAYVDSIAGFLALLDARGYRQLIEMHYRYNESVLGVQPTPLGRTPQAWAMTVLYHQTVRDTVLDPAGASARLAQLKQVLKRQTKEGSV